MPVTTTGLGSSLGVGAESTYGTAATVDHFFEFQSETFKLVNNNIVSNQLRAGRMFQAASRRTLATRDVNGGWSMEVPDQGFGLLLNEFHGNVVAPVQQGSTTAYKQTHNIGLTDPYGKSLTTQIVVPGVTGTQTKKLVTGTKLTALTIAVSANQNATTQITADGQDLIMSTASITTPTYPSGLQSFAFMGGTVTIDSVVAALVTDATLALNLAYKVDRQYLGSSGLKAQPLTNGAATSTLTLTLDWQDTTLYQNFRAGAISTVVLDLVGSQIAAPYNRELKITLEAVGWDGDTPTVDGPDVINSQPPLTVLAPDSGNAPVKIEYTSTDTAI